MGTLIEKGSFHFPINVSYSTKEISKKGQGNSTYGITKSLSKKEIKNYKEETMNKILSEMRKVILLGMEKGYEADLTWKVEKG